MEIPQNNQTSTKKDELISKLLSELSNNPCATIYYTNGLNEQFAREIGREFRAKGYYARLCWHSNERFTFFYSLCIGKEPLRDVNARLAWSEQL